MKKIVLLALVSVLTSVGYSYAAPCSATLVSDAGKISFHVPAISVGSESYSADLTYAPTSDGRYWLAIENVQAGLTSCGPSAATIFSDGPNIDVLIPDLDLSGISYWVKFVYSPSTDGHIWLILLNYGQNLPKGNIAGTTVYHAPTGERKYSYYHYIPASALNRNPVRILLYTHGSGKIDSYADMEKFILNTEIPRIKPYCEQYGYALVVMVTPRSFGSYPDYKMNTYNMVRWVMFNNAFDKPGYEFYKRPDLQFVKVIDEFVGFLGSNGYPAYDKVFITGFSAGGFAANRFSVLHPGKVAAAASGGAGAFLYPVVAWNGTPLTYPVGLHDIGQIPGNTYSLEDLKKIPHFMFIGENDTNDPVGMDDMFDPEHSALINTFFGSTMQMRNEMYSNYLSSIGVRSAVKIYPGIAHVYNSDMLTDSMLFFESVSTNE